MNVMCDTSQFVIVLLVPNEILATLVDHFMQHVLLKFGISYLVILDYGSPSKDVFSEMYKVLKS